MVQQHERGSDPHSYEAFARRKVIRAIDGELIRLAPPSHRVLDSATGTGAMIGHLLAQEKLVHPFEVIGIDIDPQALAIASQKFRSFRDTVRFVQASSESLPFSDNSFDLFVMGNALHLTDIKKALAEGHRVLQPGRIFLANTAYESTRSILPETRRIWGTWISLAKRYLRSIGYPDIDTIPHPRNLENYSAGDFHAAAIHAGYRKVEVTFREVLIDADSFKAIGDYGGFAEGALPTVNLEKATEALRHTVNELFDRFRLTHIPRNWMFLIAQK